MKRLFDKRGGKDAPVGSSSGSKEWVSDGGSITEAAEGMVIVRFV